MGKFIVFEGLDGSGKSSQIKLLKNALEDMGEKVYITAEPTDGNVGKMLRKILSDGVEVDMAYQAALFAADRIEHNINGIEKYLSDGYTVICDRYYYSSLAYQGKSGVCDFDWVLGLNLNCDRIRKPDICFFLDVNPNTCKKRIDETRDNVELYEKSAELMQKTRNGFLEVLDLLEKKYEHNIVRIDANDSIDNISKEIMKYV